MTIPLLVRRSLRQHAFSSAIAVLSIALSCGLVMTVWMTRSQAQQAFSESTGGFDAVLGARSSKLQLVLNALFHLEASPGNLPLADYEQIKRHPAVAAAFPIAVGDNFYGWRIVGTLPEMLDAYSRDGKAALAEGRTFALGTREAVVGFFAAQKLGWKTGATFQPYHGLNFDPQNQHEELYTVVGVLAPTNTPLDRVICIPLEGVQTMSGHDARAASEVSAVLVKLRAPSAGFMLDLLYNRQGNRLTFAFPVAAIVADLFGKIGWVDRVLTWVAYLVAVMAAAGMMASLYASMANRRRDWAILRALGARRRTLFGLVLSEAMALGTLGAILGVVVYCGLISVVSAALREQTGVVMNLSELPTVVWACPLVMPLLSAVSGLLPAWSAYRSPVAEALSPTS